MRVRFIFLLDINYASGSAGKERVVDNVQKVEYSKESPQCAIHFGTLKNPAIFPQRPRSDDLAFGGSGKCIGMDRAGQAAAMYKDWKRYAKTRAKRACIAGRHNPTSSRQTLKAVPQVAEAMRRVPFDILCDIALYALPNHPRPFQNAAPLSFCQVSSDWRMAALSTPKLWSTLFLEVRDIEELKIYEKRVIEWFRRAKSRPLSFYIYFESSDDIIDAKDSVPLMLESWSCLMPQVRQLGIGADWTVDILHHFCNLSWELPTLEYLDFFNSAVYGYNEPGLYSDATIPFVAALRHRTPKLLSVAVNDVFITVAGGEKLLPWSQLTQVMQVGEFLVGDGLPEAPVPRLVHTQLTDLKLRLRLASSFSILDILNLVEMPHLRSLALGHRSDPAASDPPPPPPSSISCLKHVQSLSIDHGWSANPEYVADILHATMKLRNLQLEHFSALEDVILKAMCEPILPHLKTLRISATNITYYSPDAFDPQLFADMLRSRCGQDTLHDVRVFIHHWPEGEGSKLARLRAALEILALPAGVSVKIVRGRDETWESVVQTRSPIFKEWHPLTRRF
ncbi:unnamed protein product [Cyclocybe aegerita]|uniref:F-box domain-containing protein n=1 Tax=Cyclocybe aegerita TaxID=1973307 RepID=A0A8S0X0M9_CYCAE|nr:unnamed protein product [Cyclocybe aegerita]